MLYSDGIWYGGYVEGMGYVPSDAGCPMHVNYHEYQYRCANGAWTGGFVEGFDTYLKGSGGSAEITVIFDRSDSKIYVMMDGAQVKSFDAANNVASNSKGIWSSGTYDVYTQTKPNTRKSDSYDSKFGTYGNYITYPFIDANGKYRDGMSLHSGYSDDYNRVTEGCIRTTDEAMSFIQNLINTNNGKLTKVIVQE
jgi:hypothetical protein